MDYEEWLRWREEYFKEGFNLLKKEELTEEQQMEAWEKYLNETDSGHRPC
jgi:ribosome biogenesis GTPase A